MNRVEDILRKFDNLKRTEEDMFVQLVDSMDRAQLIAMKDVLIDHLRMVTEDHHAKLTYVDHLIRSMS